MIPSGWKTALIDIDVDDVLSAEVNLGAPYEYLMVLIPTITSSTVTVTVSNASGGTFYPVYVLDADATGDLAQITSATGTSHALVFQIGGVQYIKILCDTSQTSTDKSFTVRGFNRG